MYKFFCLLSLFTSVFHQLTAQLFPKEGSKLNYTIIGFSFPTQKNAVKYKIQLAAKNYYDVDSFENKVIANFYSGDSKMIERVPAFGLNYTWRVIYISSDSSVTKGALHHFSTGSIPATDTAINRLRITNGAKKYADAFVILDEQNVICDMHGTPVWYLPVIEKIDSNLLMARDLKLSPKGTITFFANMKVYETNYNGELLWSLPKSATKGRDAMHYFYHHQFSMLNNGHYMALINPPPPQVTEVEEKNDPDSISDIQKKSLGSIEEYDSAGKVIWSWESFDFFKKFPQQTLKSYFYEDVGSAKTLLDVHLNAFYFDEKNKAVYLSFKNISSIVKIKYPEGNVLAVYGNLAKQPGVQTHGSFFCGQHSCNISSEGYLYLYNNNSCNPAKPPEIVMMKMPATQNDTLQKVWEYSLSFDEKDPDGQTYSHFPVKLETPQNNGRRFFTTKFQAGGNVTELPDHSIFISMSGDCGRLLIVSPDHTVLWSAVSEKFLKDQDKWVSNDLYKASIIVDPKDMERLIWNAETGKDNSR